MILEVEHSLVYSYTDVVSLNPHYFYLTPNATPYQRLISNELLVLPQADKLIKNVDQEGNIQHICFVNISTKRFVVKSDFKIESHDFNNFDFILFPYHTAKFPFSYPGRIAEYANIYFDVNLVHPLIKSFGDNLAKENNHDTINFLTELTLFISKNFEYISRERGDAVKAEETLMSKSGSCRDFSVFMMAVCASQGFLTRFVSGYLYGSDRHQHDLHAWVEVFLPGGGWRGFDPTEGQMVNKNYITLARSLEPAGISPVRGSFRGVLGVASALETHVSIREVV